MKKYLALITIFIPRFFIAPALLLINPVMAFPGDTAYYFSERGKLLCRDDNAVKTTSYVIKTRKQFHEIFHEIIKDDTMATFSAEYNPATVLSISRHTSRKVERLLRHGAVHDPLVTENIVEVLNKSILRRMYDNIQSRCKSNDERRFKEHGGVLLPDGTITCISGDIADPRWFAGATLFIKQDALVYYHSHPCGCVEKNSNGAYEPVEERPDPNKVLFAGSKETELICYIQGPSKQDQDAVGEGKGYVFGMKDGAALIYIYDREGVKATLPVSFVKRVRKSESPEVRKIESYTVGMFPGLGLPGLF